MQGTVDGFSYGLVTPVAAFLMACLSAALGLRCTARSLRQPHSRRPGRLALGAAAIGSGVWAAHVIGMTGFAVSGTPVDYDVPTSLASLGLGILMIGIGIFIVGSRRTAPMALVTGGTVTGLGIATIHFLSMAGVRLHGRVEYDTPTVALSVLIAVAAAIAALWTVVAHRGFRWELTASAVMGIAATGMHYTGMAAVHVRLDPGAATASGGGQEAPTLLPMLIGPAVLLLSTAVMVLFDPLTESGRGNGEPPEALFSGPAGVPAQRTRRGAQPRLPHRASAKADRASARSEHGGAPDFHDW